MVRVEAMTASDERTLGIQLAKVEGIERVLARADDQRAAMHHRLDAVVDDVSSLRTDVVGMKTTVSSTKEVTDEVRAWKQRGIGALGVVGFGASAITWAIMHWLDKIADFFNQ